MLALRSSNELLGRWHSEDNGGELTRGIFPYFQATSRAGALIQGPVLPLLFRSTVFSSLKGTPLRLPFYNVSSTTSTEVPLITILSSSTIMDLKNQLSRGRLEATKIPLRKAISTNGLRSVLRNIENNTMTGKVLRKNSAKTILIQPSKENIKAIPKMALTQKSSLNIFSDHNKLTKIIKRTISATKNVINPKDKGNDAKPADKQPKIPSIPRIILDIDSGEVDPIQYNEYASDVMRHLKELETSYTIRQNFLSSQIETNGEMRSDLIDWVHRNASRFELYEETFYSAVGIIDLYLQNVEIHPNCLPLLGVTALLIASKYEEVGTPNLSELVKMGQFRFSRSDILHMECSMLKALDFKVGRPVPIQFLRRYSQANRCNRLSHNLSKFFLELSLLSHQLSHVPPSLLAAAASCLSLWVLADMKWTPELEFYSGYSAEQVAPVTRDLARFIENHETLKTQAVRKKFLGEKYLQVARLPQLTAIVKCFP